MKRSYFENKVAVVTGAASGIGLGLARHLNQLGATVVLVDIDAPKLHAAAEEMQPSGLPYSIHEVDVRGAKALQRVLEQTVSEYGSLDFMFNNAGIGDAGEMRDFPAEWWEKVMDVNCNGVIHGTRLAYDIMVKQGSGHIVNTSSLAGLVPSPYQTAYCAAKFAVVGLSKALALEGKDLGVHVTVACPGFIRTPIFDNLKITGVELATLQESMPPAFVWATGDQTARMILRATARKKMVVPITWFAKLSIWSYRLAPWLVHWMLRSALRKARKQRTATDSPQPKPVTT